MYVATALVLSALAFITGIIAIGQGDHWRFTTKDYLRGKRNAIIYLWVILSTTWSIVHTMLLLQYGLRYNWTPIVPHDAKWFVMESFVGLLLLSAHIFVAYKLHMEVGPRDKYLWGKHRTRVHN